MDHINIAEHEGGHPRKGAVDLIPIHPLNEETYLEDCGKVALKIGEKLKSYSSELSIFYFGHADIPLKRDLVQRRKEVGWFNASVLKIIISYESYSFYYFR